MQILELQTSRKIKCHLNNMSYCLFLTEIHRWCRIKVQSDTSVNSVMLYILGVGIRE